MTAQGIVIEIEPLLLNLKPEGFHKYATYYYEAYKDCVSEHSPALYFLLALSLELELKSRIFYQKSLSSKEMKSTYSHDLFKLYQDLDTSNQILTPAELSVLKRTSDLYSPRPGNKAFEYYQPLHLMTAYSQFPSLKILNEIVLKFIGNEHRASKLKEFHKLLGRLLQTIENGSKSKNI